MSDGPPWTPPPGSIPTLAVPSLDGVRRVHLVGIGGAGMRNLAKLLVARGVAVSGSDLKDGPALEGLRAIGAEVRVGHDAANVGDPDAVVVSSAIPERNPELRAAEARGLAIWRRQQALAALVRGHRAVAIAGTHGKTTVTSMLATVLEDAGADPTYLIGGDLNESGSGARHGGGDAFVFEADESDGSFLLIEPWCGVITNIEVDHVDFYAGGLDEIVDAFATFARRCDSVVACGDDASVRDALARAGVTATTYGFDEGNDLVVTVTDLGPDGARGTVRVDGGPALPVRLRIDGPHNLLNAAAAIAVARRLGVAPETAAAALEAFGGVHRRFELRGTARGARFFDDYGHTPTEMAVTIDTARRYGPRRLVALVQPHRYSRVQALWRDLGASVAGADIVIVTDVYGAAQPPIPGITGKLVVDGVQLASPGRRTVYLPHRRDVVTFLEREVRAGDLVVTMGCGDVWMLGDEARAAIEGNGR
ncbi:MAG TPA: UDP-N-acetylmuramate--L-alanine ligase [Actinomycetota bacterium]|jgi:UDP-N-acetylmuramate--alanine ligase